MRVSVMVLALCLAAACGPQQQVAEAPAAAPQVKTSIDIADARIRPAPAGAVSAGYLNLTAHGATDRLLAASSPIAERVELHAHLQGEDGLMQMREVEGGVEVPAGETIAFAPGGLHLMLFNLTQELAPRQSAPVTLTFERAGAMEAQFQVGEPPLPGAASAAPAESHGGHP